LPDGAANHAETKNERSRVQNRREQVVIKRRASDQEARNMEILNDLPALDVIKREGLVIKRGASDQLALAVRRVR